MSDDCLRVTVHQDGREYSAAKCVMPHCWQPGVWCPATNAAVGPWFCRQHSRNLPEDREPIPQALRNQLASFKPIAKAMDFEAYAERQAIQAEEA